MRVAVFALPLIALACAPQTAVVRGQTVARVTAEYTDHHVFAVTHHDAYPEARGASSGLREYDGRMAGRVCGTEVWLEADYRGRYLELAGFYEPNDGSVHTINQLQLEVRDYGGQRHIRGAIGAGQIPVVGWVGRLAGADGHGAGRTIGDFAAHEGDRVIDLSYDTGRLEGWVNGERFALHAEGDDAFAGTVTVGGSARDYVFRGVRGFWAMPAADQAAVLPMLLTCKLDEHRGFEAGGQLNLTSTLTANEIRDRR